MRSFILPALTGLLSLVGAQTCPAAVTSTSATLLVIASSDTAALQGTLGLQGYGIPYQVLTVPSTGATLPALNSSSTVGNFGGIIILSEVTYQYSTGYASALTTDQWQQLYDYQTAFGARMVRIDVFPGPAFGAATVDSTGAGCCGTGVEQLISYTNTSGFPTANLISGQTMSTIGLYHYPATITDTTTTWPVASFGTSGSFTSSSVAAVINSFPNGAGKREQMVYFISWGADWSPTSNYLQHAWIHWVTRGLYAGFRRIYFNTQIDDVHLETSLYEPANVDFRIGPNDLTNHVTWMADINSRLPKGSSYIIELGHNGNGNIENATGIAENANGNEKTCPDSYLIEYADQIDTPLEFVKPIGSGTDIWPTTPTVFSSSLACMKLDALYSWFSNTVNRDKFAHISHTYTHEALDNATYHDTTREISFNQAWLKLGGIDAGKFSANGIIPPAITGLHNGDAIKAWLDNGIKYVVGDNTRPILMNPTNAFWSLTSTVAVNGYDGLEIVPRWATTIYYNCDLPKCTVDEWIATSAGAGDFTTLLNNARDVNTMHLLGLHHDPFMFHQANLRTDVPQLTINGKTATYSLLMTWVETVLQEMYRLTTWPIITKQHDDLALDFIARRTRDQCGYSLAWNYSPDGKSISGATVSTTSGSCSTPIPVTFPGPVTSNNGGTPEQVGSDPLTVWVTLSGKPVTFTLVTPIVI